MANQVVFGTSVLSNPVPNVESPVVSFSGLAMDGTHGFSLNEDLMSRHVLLLGGSGCGKTNVFCFTMERLRSSMTDQDVAIVFDTKGEFFEWFGRDGDYVLGNSARFRPISYTWNIFDELLADGTDDANVSMNARELSAALFHDRGSETQPFFCDAARDLFQAMVIHFVRQWRLNPESWDERLNNEHLLAAFKSFTSSDWVKMLKYYPDFRSYITYIGDGTSNQALGVFGELNGMLSEYFVGILAEHRPGRSISMRKAVRGKGARAIFIEYDLSVGESLTPVYRLLIDQALKEALGRNEEASGRPHVYLVCDEFKLLPKLQHIDDALNFGRGLGVRVMAGIQSIDQLYDIYGQEKGAVIASGFGSLFAFHTNDGASRDYITKRFGSNVMVYDYNNAAKNIISQNERDGNTVEEWDQMSLGLGQAAIGLGYEPPFLFQFKRYERG